MQKIPKILTNPCATIEMLATTSLLLFCLPLWPTSLARMTISSCTYHNSPPVPFVGPTSWSRNIPCFKLVGDVNGFMFDVPPRGIKTPSLFNKVFAWQIHDCNCTIETVACSFFQSTSSYFFPTIVPQLKMPSTLPTTSSNKPLPCSYHQ